MITNDPARRVAWLALAVSLLPAAAQAQQVPQPIIQPFPQASDPASRLAANLQILAQNPRDVIALTEAGRSAIAVGDGNAAIGFLTRAEELSPGDSRIKADIGSALLLLEEPGEALKLFAEASALGLPDRVFAKDRGLAYDLTGDQHRAQRDYQTALRQSDGDDEVTRRLALSYGISGDRDQGLKLLDPLVKKQDQAAWRDRAFILAMNGDIKDAERIAETVMPYGMAGSMTPFLRRLASLTPQQRARAVNFGTMPDAGVRTAMAETAVPFRSVDALSARVLMPVEPQPTAKVAEPSPAQSRRTSKELRRRPGRERQTFAASQPETPSASSRKSGSIDTRIDSRIDTRIAAVDSTRLPPDMAGLVVRLADPAPKPATVAAPPPPPPPVAARPDPEPSPLFEVPTASAHSPAPVTIRSVDLPHSGLPSGSGAAFVAAPSTAPVAPPPPPPILVASIPPPPLATAPSPARAVAATLAATPSRGIMGPPSPAPGFSSTADFAPTAADPPRTEIKIQQAAAVAEPAPGRAAKVAPPPVSLASIMSSIVPESESTAAPLPNAAQLRTARIAAQKKAAAEAAAKTAKEDAAREAAEKAATAKRNPARVWVQVATGNNEAGLPSTWKKLREKAPDIFKGKTAAVVPFKATNRVLVGPFKSQAEARALVSAMSKAGLQGSTYSSEAGQEVARIGGK